MSIGATYDAVHRQLQLTVDQNGDAIEITRDAAGTIFVNGGATPVQGGPATVANTDVIEFFGDVGNDTFSLDESNGTLPPTTMFGGAGNDTLTGGSGQDIIDGGAGDDVMIGGAENDVLFAGSGNDRLTGGRGDDDLFGEAGNDTLVWNAGDGSDTVEGGDDIDTAVVNGGNAAEIFTITANGGRVRVGEASSASQLDIGTTENIVIHGGGGDDAINASTLAALVSLTLDGGAGNDRLTGGEGNDALSGGNGNDTFAWIFGDGSDTVEGDDGFDGIVLNGGAAAEDFTITANGGRVRVGEASSGSQLDIGTTESIVVNGGDGDDHISAGNGLSGLVSLILDGGAGNDTITGGDGADILIGFDGDDVVIGGRGDDQAFLDAGNDIFAWNPGDGSDTVDGGDGFDALQFTGSNADEHIDISAEGSHARLVRDVGNVTMDLERIERIKFEALGGADTITVNDLSGTGVALVQIDLAALPDGIAGDNQPDNVIVNGTGGNDAIAVLSGPDVIQVQGLAAEVDVLSNETIDSLIIRGGDGKDTIDASALLASSMALTIDGGAGNDIIVGSAGNDTLLGGDGSDTVTGGRGNDVAFLGAGGDIFLWNPGDGSDTVDGGDGFDILQFTGSNAGEHIDIAANGSHVQLSRDIGGVAMDLNQVEHIFVQALGGADTITVNDLSGTGIQSVQIALASLPGGGPDDNQPDSVTVAGTSGDDAVVVQDQFGAMIVHGLAAEVLVSSGEVIDSLIINGGGGDDAIDASAIAAPLMTLEFDGGAGNDTITGSGGNDTITGGDGDDVLQGGLGADILVGAAGIDTASYGNSGAGVAVDLGAGTGNGGDAQGDTLTEIENLTGSGFADTLIGDASNNVLDGGAGDDLLTGGAGNDVLLGGDGHDVATGGRGNDVAALGAGSDEFIWNPGDGSDAVDGGDGFDFLQFNGSPGNEHIDISANGSHVRFFREAGSVTMDINQVENIAFQALGSADAITVNDLSGTGVQIVDIALSASGGDNQPDSVTVNGTAGDDAIVVGTTDGVSIRGLAAEVDVFAGETIDSLIISGGAGNDAIDGSGLRATSMALTADGGTGDDVIIGGAGNDVLRGGDGSDVLEGGRGADTLIGGAGIDTASYATSGAAVRVDLEDGASGGDAAGDTFSGVENLTGSAFADTLTGDAGDNVLTGGAGNDTLSGGSGNDTVIGGAGNDHMSGGVGQDTAVFNVNFASAHVSFAGDTIIIDSAEGHDDLSGFETFRFTDGTFRLNDDHTALVTTSPPKPAVNDFDGDGHSDILWQNADGSPAIWLTSGTTLTSGANVGFNPGRDWHEIGSGDFNGDGKSDILWQNRDGTIAEWSVNGTSLVSGASVALNPGPNAHAIGTGDFNGDGKSDILFQNSDGTPSVWLMDDANVLSAADVGFNPGAAWHEIAAADFNGDGKADILWQNADGTPAVWLMDGTNLISGSNVGFNPGADWHVAGAGDFNGDGKADILWQNHDGTPAVWLMNGTSLISGANVGFNPGADWHVVNTGDYNADGKADIVWQNKDGTPAVWLMNGTSLISGANVGFDPGSDWHVVPQHHDLFV